MTQCREGTLSFFRSLDESQLRRSIHPDFSPLGWHFGHIVYTEAYWLLHHIAGKPQPFPQLHTLFRADGLPKAQRGEALPSPDFLLEYAHSVRQDVLTVLEDTPFEAQERLWRFVLQHESMHTETACFLRLLGGMHTPVIPASEAPEPAADEAMCTIPAGPFDRGSDDVYRCMDNECQAHTVELAAYRIDETPVTKRQFATFLDAGGYQQPQWWSSAGWQWRTTQEVEQPLYWHLGEDTHPVMGVSFYEAEAYAAFVGKRLPTEAEWDKAASWDPSLAQTRLYPWGAQPLTHEHAHFGQLHGLTSCVYAHPEGQSAYGCLQMLGNTWEWTASHFAPYPGFEVFPYPGYSSAYFDQAHRVLRGGSWASRRWTLRNSFRNWYSPDTRLLLAGFRCAQDLPSTSIALPTASPKTKGSTVVKHTPPPQETETPDTRVQYTTLSVAPDDAQEREELRACLTGPEAFLPCRYFYDEPGSLLFEKITALDAYYPTRTEQAILEQYADQIVEETGPVDVVELGSGSSTKTRTLLAAYAKSATPMVYMPIDVSGEMVKASAPPLLKRFPHLRVHGLIGTYEEALAKLPAGLHPKRLLLFLGSTIGNFAPDECDAFLRMLRGHLQQGDLFLLGLDRQKPIAILETAYNDPQGVTAAFNKNILHHINRRFQANFDPANFAHIAFYNTQQHQIEMHLESTRTQEVYIEALDLTLSLPEGRRIQTEISRKFDLAQMRTLFTSHGFSPLHDWSDPDDWFSLILFRCT